MDNGKIYWGANGTLMNSANLSTGTGFAFDNLLTTYPNNKQVVCSFGHYTGEKFRTRFSASEWRYGPASTDYKEISTANMPALALPSGVPDASLFYNTVTYTGNGTAIGSGGQAITVGFQPDFVLIKNRDQNDDWRLFDSVRGAQNYLEPNSTNDQNQASVNTNTENYVAICLKAGGAPSADNSGGRTPTNNSVMKAGVAQTASNYFAASTGTYPTRMSIAEHGGFSIFTYEGTGSNLTVPHGLDRAPEFVIVKAADGKRTWVCYHSGLARTDPETDYIAIGGGGNNGGDPVVDDATQWNDTAPTATLLSLGTGGALNTSGSEGIAYAFAKTPGLIGIGSYRGNQGTATGPYVHVDDGAFGFKPACLIIKAAQDGGSGYDWFTYTNKTTNIYNTNVNSNLNEGLVSLNRNSTTSTVGSFPLQFTSTGFRVTGSNLSHNKSDKNFIYVAFAEEAFGNNIRPPSS